MTHKHYITFKFQYPLMKFHPNIVMPICSHIIVTIVMLQYQSLVVVTEII